MENTGIESLMLNHVDSTATPKGISDQIRKYRGTRGLKGPFQHFLKIENPKDFKRNKEKAQKGERVSWHYLCCKYSFR